MTKISSHLLVYLWHKNIQIKINPLNASIYHLMRKYNWPVLMTRFSLLFHQRFWSTNKMSPYSNETSSRVRSVWQTLMSESFPLILTHSSEVTLCWYRLLPSHIANLTIIIIHRPVCQKPLKTKWRWRGHVDIICWACLYGIGLNDSLLLDRIISNSGHGHLDWFLIHWENVHYS